MNKNILIIHPTLGNGGAEKIIAFLSNILSDDYNVSLLLLDKSKITLPIKKKVNIIQKNCYSRNPIVSKNLIKGLNGIKKLINVIRREINKVNPVLIICFDLRVLLSTYIANKKSNIKILFSERADPYENRIYWQILLKNIYKNISYIIFQTKEARDFYGERIKLKSRIIYNPALSRNLIENNTIYKEKQKIIFSAGRFQHRKGFDLLIKAFSILNNVNSNYKLYIYGKGQEESNLRMLADYYGVSSKVHFFEPVNNVIEENINSEIFVLPSRSEGIPNILIEAMVSGIPCVASDCSPGGARLLSDNGRYCLLSKKDDYLDLAEKLIYATNNLEYIRKMADNAKTSMYRFDSKNISEQWKDTINYVIEK